MKKHIAYPKIQQFRDVVSTVTRQATFVKLDKNGDPVYNNVRQKPIIKFTGTVKLHGTNAAVSYNTDDGIWFQSRNNIITKEKDNAGFAQFADVRSEMFESMVKFIAQKNDIKLKMNTITIYGEWAGKGIQKGVAISEIERAFFIFGVKCTPHDEELDSYWLDTTKMGLSSVKSGVFDINGFIKFNINIDFNNPSIVQNKLIDITEAVEENCPVADVFGVKGIGKGVVWTGEYNGTILRFKIESEKEKSEEEE